MRRTCWDEGTCETHVRSAVSRMSGRKRTRSVVATASPAMAVVKRRRITALDEHAIVGIQDIWVGNVFRHLSLVDRVNFSRANKLLYQGFHRAWPIPVPFAKKNHVELRRPDVVPIFKLIADHLGFGILERHWAVRTDYIEPPSLHGDPAFIDWARPFLDLNEHRAVVQGHWHVRLYADHAWIHDACVNYRLRADRFYRLDVLHNHVHRSLFFAVLEHPSTPVEAMYAPARTEDQLSQAEKDELGIRD